MGHTIGVALPLTGQTVHVAQAGQSKVRNATLIILSLPHDQTRGQWMLNIIQ